MELAWKEQGRKQAGLGCLIPPPRRGAVGQGGRGGRGRGGVLGGASRAQAGRGRSPGSVDIQKKQAREAGAPPIDASSR